jgi:hypothetical protein
MGSGQRNSNSANNIGKPASERNHHQERYAVSITAQNHHDIEAESVRIALANVMDKPVTWSEK